jgi:mannose-6-phosphate isomerase-like protein (cupin superfamily)
MSHEKQGSIMSDEVRRVVTTHDATGKAIVAIDGISPSKFVRAETGTVARLMWVTDAAPADIASDADGALKKIGLAPPPSGSILRIVDFPPTPDVSGMPLDYMERSAGSDHDNSFQRPPSHPYMHRSKSIDYAIVMSGEIDMLLDDSEVHLKAGDVLVQKGTNHAWVNRGTAVCRIAFVLIDAEALR